MFLALRIALGVRFGFDATRQSALEELTGQELEVVSAKGLVASSDLGHQNDVQDRSEPSGR